MNENICEMGTCSKPAEFYGGYAGAFEWAGYTCEEHSSRLDWREELKPITVTEEES